MTQVRDVPAQVRAGAAAIDDPSSAISLMSIRANDLTLSGYCQAQCVALTVRHGMYPGQV